MEKGTGWEMRRAMSNTLHAYRSETAKIAFSLSHRPRSRPSMTNTTGDRIIPIFGYGHRPLTKMFSQYNKGHLAGSAQPTHSHINKLTTQKRHRKEIGINKLPGTSLFFLSLSAKSSSVHLRTLKFYFWPFLSRIRQLRHVKRLVFYEMRNGKKKIHFLEEKKVKRKCEHETMWRTQRRT